MTIFRCKFCDFFSVLFPDMEKHYISDHPSNYAEFLNQEFDEECHIHNCAPAFPCQMDGCPHCTGEQEAIKRWDDQR